LSANDFLEFVLRTFAGWRWTGGSGCSNDNRSPSAPFRADDLPRLREWMRDSELARTWARPPIVPDNAFERDLPGKFSRFAEPGFFAIDDSYGHLVGRIEFEQLQLVDRTPEVMIALGEPSARGKGLGTDAMVTLLRHLFDDPQVERVWLTVLAWNEPAIDSYRKVGFVVEGRLKDDCWMEGASHGQVIMGILREEFHTGWPRVAS
jgi:RimJ/RimL family protein N-acetyltransferase